MQFCKINGIGNVRMCGFLSVRSKEMPLKRVNYVDDLSLTLERCDDDDDDNANAVDAADSMHDSNAGKVFSAESCWTRRFVWLRRSVSLCSVN